MRGTLKQRYEGSWSLILDLGYQTDPITGKKKRRQKWITFRGTKKQAEAALNEHVRSAQRGEFVEPSKMTLGEWLKEWLKGITPSVAPATLVRYTGIVDNSLIPKLGGIRLQALKPFDLEGYYADLATAKEPLSPATIELHHVVLWGALEKAENNDLVTRNVAAKVQHKPRRHDESEGEHVAENVWTAEEAARFLKAANDAGTQKSAFYSVALDSGARRGELAALKWDDLDISAGTMTIRRKLLKGGREPVFGATKTRKIRTLTLTGETVARLKVHKQQQAELKLRNRLHYHDLGLVFAKEWGDQHNRRDSLGLPLQVNNMGSREFDRLIKAAGVKRITIHGLRHTCATLMIQSGEPVNVVQKHLGHSKVEMTLNIYAHVLKSMERGAADRRALWLHGTAKGR